MTSLKRKLIMLFKENLKRNLNWTEENGKCEVLILLFVKLAYSSSPNRVELDQANQVTDQTRGEEAGYVKNQK